MADEIYDKLQVDSSTKLTFPGVDIKEIKQSTTIEVQETRRKRVPIDPSNPDAQAGKVDTGIFKPDDGHEVVLVVVKLAKVDANKGTQPVLVGNQQFHPANTDASSKLEGDGTVALWKKDAPPKFLIKQGDDVLFVFNPNRTAVVLEIVYGISKIPPKSSTGGSGSSETSETSAY